MTANDAVVLMTGATTSLVAVITVIANAVVRVRKPLARRATDPPESETSEAVLASQMPAEPEGSGRENSSA